MEAKKYLRQLKKLDAIIKNKIIERQQWKDMALGVTAQMGGERVQSSGSHQKMADAVDKCIQLESEIDHYIDCLIDKKREILGVIEQLSPDYYNLIHAYYVQYTTLEEAAESIGKSYTWATTAHGRALKKIQNILDSMR